MSVSRFDSVIDAIDLLIEDEVVEPAPVRFSPNGLSDREIEAFIDATLARGEDGMGPAQPVVAPPVPVTPVRRPARTRPATRRTAAPTGPRPNRYGGVCRNCDGYVPAGAGLLTGTKGAWVIVHNECPVAPPVQAPAPRRTRPATRRAPAAPTAAEVNFDGDAYVVTVEVEVVADGVRSAREAALLALREVFAGEVAVTVTDPRNGSTEVNITVS